MTFQSAYGRFFSPSTSPLYFVIDGMPGCCAKRKNLPKAERTFTLKLSK
jgi:hypothetical protein